MVAQSEQSIDDLTTVCPACGAMTGEPCRTKAGAVAKSVHRERVAPSPIAPYTSEITTVPVATAPAGELDVNNLMAQAIAQKVDVATIERLLAVRRELKAELAQENYFRALSKFQATCPPIEKTKLVKNKDGSERYRYAPLDVITRAVGPSIETHGFAYTFDTEQESGAVTAICRVHHEDGHTEEYRFTAPVDERASMNAPQRVASALTYAKRYAFCDAFGIMTADADDDAVFTTPVQDVTGVVQPASDIRAAEGSRGEADAYHESIEAALDWLKELRAAGLSIREFYQPVKDLFDEATGEGKEPASVLDLINEKVRDMRAKVAEVKRGEADG